PQIYVTDLTGGGAQRVSLQGDYNTDAAFSPKGDKVAYQSRHEGSFDIYTVDAGGGHAVQMTFGEGSNQQPCWSPDGRYLLFSSTRGGRSKLYLMLVDGGKIVSSLTEDEGNDTSPAWSWWLGQ